MNFVNVVQSVLAAMVRYAGAKRLRYPATMVSADARDRARQATMGWQGMVIARVTRDVLRPVQGGLGTSGNEMMTRTGRLWVAVAALLLVVPMLGGCREKDNTVMLGIVGYNYTDRYIHRFSVGGAGGTNVFLSDHESGGGSTACCLGYNPARPLPITLPVEWMFGYQLDENGEISVPDEYHAATAILDGPVPEDPYNLEVHFMPDGTVRLMITAEHSAPLINVDRSPEAVEARSHE